MSAAPENPFRFPLRASPTGFPAMSAISGRPCHWLFAAPLALSSWLLDIPTGFAAKPDFRSTIERDAAVAALV